jgi:putative ABC transport system permease protein
MRRGKRLLNGLSEEIRDHIEREIQDNLDHGMTPDEARRAACRKFGNISQVMEDTHAVWTWSWLDTLWQDLRFVVRRLRREPGFTLVALLTLTFAVGANTAILGVADAVLFRPLPYAEPGRVFVIEMLDRLRGGRSTMTPYAFIDAINDMHGTLSKVGMTATGPRVLEATPDGPRPVRTLDVSPGYFQILGVTPARGRLFDAGDQGHEGRAAMLSYSAWQERFAGDDAFTGKTVTIGNTTFDIVGVLPRDFIFPSIFAGTPAVITEMRPVPRGAPGGTMHAIVRLAPGMSREQAQAEMDAALAPIFAGDSNWKNTTPVLDDIRTVLYGVFSLPVMRLLLVSAGLILLIGCANLTNMLLVRSQRRRQETAMRLALGAGRFRLIRPIVLEALLIGLSSGALALGVTMSLFDVLLRQVPPAAYGNAPVGINGRVAIISLVMSLAGALVFAVMPVWRAARLDVLSLLRGRITSKSERAWLGRPLVMVQVALSVVAAFGAVIAARAFVTVLNTPLGFSPDGVVRFSVARPPRMDERTARVVAIAPGRIELADPPPPAQDASSFYVRIVDALRARPDVISAGASTGLPLDNSGAFSGANLPGVTTRSGVGIEYVLPGFFETIGVTLRRGRLLTWDDHRSDPAAAIIGEAAGHKLFGEKDPLGQIFIQERTNRQFHVVGVIADVRQFMDGQNSLRAYVFPDGRGVLRPVARMRTQEGAILADLKSTVHAVAPNSLVEDEWWSESIRQITAYRNPRFQAIVLGGLGVLALSLTALGVFGVVNYLVVSRTREMGVRLAIGASPRSLIAFVLKGALTPVLIGLAAGILSVRWLRPLAEAQLFKVQTRDLSTFMAAAAAVALASIAAAYLPARRAAAVDPVAALRSE